MGHRHQRLVAGGIREARSRAASIQSVAHFDFMQHLAALWGSRAPAMPGNPHLHRLQGGLSHIEVNIATQALGHGRIERFGNDPHRLGDRAPHLPFAVGGKQGKESLRGSILWMKRDPAGNLLGQSAALGPIERLWISLKQLKPMGWRTLGFKHGFTR